MTDSPREKWEKGNARLDGYYARFGTGGAFSLGMGLALRAGMRCASEKGVAF